VAKHGWSSALTRTDEGVVGSAPEPEDRLTHEDSVGLLFSCNGSAREVSMQRYTEALRQADAILGTEDTASALVNPRSTYLEDGSTCGGALKKPQ